MASENVKRARAGYVALAHFYETRDPVPIRRHLERVIHPACVVAAGSPEVFVEGTWQGHDGLFRFLTNQLDALEDMWIEPRDFIEMGEWLVVPVDFGGRAKHTGMEISLSPVHLLRVAEDHRVIEFWIHRTLGEALAAIEAQASTDR
jgi:hypothetical protein